MTPLEELRSAVERAAGAVGGNGAMLKTRPTLERPKQAGHGDYATNAAMLLAPLMGTPPREIAALLADELAGTLGPALDRAEVAGPGFLNLFLGDAWCTGAVSEVVAAGEGYGGGGADPAERILVEFVSANPTGPLTAASGRHAAYGDALARLLEFAGNTVEREYYFNDAGAQVVKLGESIRARARGEEPPEDGYQGDYVTELAEQIPGAADADPEALAERGIEILFERIRATLEEYRVSFDSWFSEQALHEGSPNAVERAHARLEEKGHLFRSEGAVWLRTTDFGDDKDRVLERSTGEPTYFGRDIAYHEHKLERGYDRLINVLGADHHGYIARLKTAIAALGGDPDKYEIPILQFVHLVERGERASMSKRRGDFVTLDELISEIGVDAARFFMLQRSHDTTVDLDLDLARDQSRDNPVYYVQYAHARITSVLHEVGEQRVAQALAEVGDSALPELHPSERDLVKRVLEFPTEVAEATERRAPHRIAVYVLELAQQFSAFYRDCRVKDVEPEELRTFRLALCVATQRVIARSLDLLGVSAPESM